LLFYIFGASFYDEVNTTNASLQPFKYNGKELDMMHEIFHTLGFDDFKLSDKGHGIMNYPPQKPDQKDVNNLVNNDFLPKIVIQ
jgi:hypothetical protein